MDVVMNTFLNLKIQADSKDKAVDILADLLLKIEKHTFGHPHDNDCGEWVFEWSNLHSNPDENEQEDL
jgi:transposase InsO family protein